MLRPRYNKNDLGFSLALVVLIYLFVALIGSTVLQLVLCKVNGISFKDFAANNIDIKTLRGYDIGNIVLMAVSGISIGASAFIYAAITKTNVVKATTMGVKPPIAHIGWGVLATLFLITMMVPLNNWIMEGIEKLGFKKPSVDIDMDIVSMIIIACVLPAFTEEMIFRGTIAQSVVGNKNKLASLATVGALFALFHMNPAQTVHQFVLGAFMALVVFRSGSIWTSVIIHLVNNLTAVILSAVGGDAFFEANAIWLFFVGLVGFAGCVVGYLFTTKSKWIVDEEQTVGTTASKVCLGVSIGICAILWIVSLLVG